MAFFRNLLFIALVLLSCAAAGVSQTGTPAKTTRAKPSAAPASANWVKSSAAYVELTLHKADIDAELLDLGADYTDEYPKVKRLKTEAQFVQAELDNMLKLDAAALPKLTESLAKLILKKIEMQVDLALLKVDHKDDHPQVIKGTRRVQIYEKAIKDLLQ